MLALTELAALVPKLDQQLRCTDAVENSGSVVRFPYRVQSVLKRFTESMGYSVPLLRRHSKRRPLIFSREFVLVPVPMSPGRLGIGFVRPYAIDRIAFAGHHQSAVWTGDTKILVDMHYLKLAAYLDRWADGGNTLFTLENKQGDVEKREDDKNAFLKRQTDLRGCCS